MVPREQRQGPWAVPVRARTSQLPPLVRLPAGVLRAPAGRDPALHMGPPVPHRLPRAQRHHLSRRRHAKERRRGRVPCVGGCGRAGARRGARLQVEVFGDGPAPWVAACQPHRVRRAGDGHRRAVRLQRERGARLHRGGGRKWRGLHHLILDEAPWGVRTDTRHGPLLPLPPDALVHLPSHAQPRPRQVDCHKRGCAALLCVRQGAQGPL
mmetsp:Transcript_27081/g.66775  ORF Transcript_27081/g.66775 Transcript_27081/m.66775 type:complete len:210 (-) Transcript_27081:2790-3419(-)